MPGLVLFSSGLCLINLILWSYYRIGYLESATLYQYLISMDNVRRHLIMIRLLQ